MGGPICVLVLDFVLAKEKKYLGLVLIHPIALFSFASLSFSWDTLRAPSMSAMSCLSRVICDWLRLIAIFFLNLARFRIRALLSSGIFGYFFFIFFFGTCSLAMLSISW